MLDLTIDTGQIFAYANIIISAMMPVVYITAGLGLGFIVVKRVISAFK